MNPIRRPAAIALLLATTLPSMTGCGMSTTTPSHETVRSETQAVMKAVTDLLPEGTRIDDRPKDVPLGCQGNGASYTGQWDAFPPSGFDVPGFVSTVPDELGDTVRVQESDVPTSEPVVHMLTTGHSQVSLTVAARTTGPEPRVNILAISWCGAKPSPSD